MNIQTLFETPEDEGYPYDTAKWLLCGWCNYFALSLQKALGYNPYIIEGKNGSGFHAFCQIYKRRKRYYVDARGITSSFDEFMIVAGEFVNDEFIIRAVTAEDVKEWDADCENNEDAYAFAEAVIGRYISYYTL